MPRLLLGHVLDALRLLPDNSVQCVITSPPYWNLRAYKTEPQVWGGDPACQHVWGPPIIADHRGTQIGKASTADQRETPKGQFCQHCDAWRGELGAEPTPDLYIAHLVEVFREVRRVLRPDGTLWLNLGDTYAREPGKGQHKPGDGTSGKHTAVYERGGGHASTEGIPPGLKAKDLCMIPARVALALQQDGWYLRSAIPWLKRNALTESVKDRPASAVEYVFLLTKSARYYCDMEAVKMPGRDWGIRYRKPGSAFVDGTPGRAKQSGGKHCNFAEAGRNRRNSDWCFESWQGLYEEDGEPLVFIINTTTFRGAHFAMFPPKLVEPMIKAGSAERGGEPALATVLDPFLGSGTTAQVAEKLSRDWIGIELQPDYVPLIEKRLGHTVVVEHVKGNEREVDL